MIKHRHPTPEYGRLEIVF